MNITNLFTNHTQFENITINTWIWGWCSICDCSYVLCTTCGNNCCNGGYGTVNGTTCPDCKKAYEHQDAAFSNNTAPTIKSFTPVN